MVGNVLNFLDTGFIECGLRLERKFRRTADLPHYKYVIRPMYRGLLHILPKPLAIPTCFFLTDMVFHQAVAMGSMCLQKHLNHALSPEAREEVVCDFTWSPLIAVAWTSLALPILYAKMRRVSMEGQKAPSLTQEQQAHFSKRVQAAARKASGQLKQVGNK